MADGLHGPDGQGAAKNVVLVKLGDPGPALPQHQCSMASPAQEKLNKADVAT